MKIHPVQTTSIAFKSLSNKDNDKNPVKKGYEQLDAMKATMAAGLSFGLYALYYITKDGTAFENLSNWGLRIAEKNHKKFGNKKALIPFVALGSVAFVFAAFIGIMAALYTAYNTPKALYKGKITAFKKEKEMDLYIKGNKVEKELYNQMNDAAKNADSEKKKELSKQYAKLKAAKNIVPDFVKNNTI